MGLRSSDREARLKIEELLDNRLHSSQETV